jgi:hypothetical protein
MLHAPSIEISIDEGTPNGVSSFLPPKPGIVVFIGEQEKTVLISSASDMRAFVEDRLGISESASPRRVDLLPVTRKIRAYPCGIGLETQWVLTRLAEQLDAELAAELFERASIHSLCFLSESLRWTIRDSADLVRTAGREDQLIIAPIPRRQDAAALGETLDDLYSLCRYPKELALAPNGTACAYKDMGRCPAACDGSEQMSDYNSRMTRAMSLIHDGLENAKSECRSRIECASATMDFETAGEQKRILDALNRLPAERYRSSRSLSSMNLLVIAPSVRRGWASVWLFGAHGLQRLCTIDENASDSVLELLYKKAQQGEGIAEITRRVMMDLGLVSRVIHAKPGRGAGRKRVSSVMDLSQDISMADLLKAINQAANPPKEDGGVQSPYKSS